MSTYWVPMAAGQVMLQSRGAWAAGTSYVAGDIVSYNGVNYLSVAPSTGVTPPATLLPPNISYGATPPASPNDGDLWYLPADTTLGIIWIFRYRAASASAYKWEYIGGPPLRHAISTQETTTAVTTWVDLATVGPRVIVPRAGDYDVDVDAPMAHS